MTVILIGLLVVSSLLFFLSFFLNGREKKLEKELEQLSIDYLQEMYHLKKRITILEEELMGGSVYHPAQPKYEPLPNKVDSIHVVIKNQVLLLAQQGLPIEQIAKQSSLTSDEVLHILESEGGMST